MRLIDDILGCMGPDLPQGRWTELAEVLLKHAESEFDNVRQVACIGIGMLAASTSNAIFAKLGNAVM